MNNELSVTETNVSGSQLNVYLQSGGDFTASNGLTINLDNSVGGVLNSSTDAPLMTAEFDPEWRRRSQPKISNNDNGQIGGMALANVVVGGTLTATAANLVIDNGTAV